MESGGRKTSVYNGMLGGFTEALEDELPLHNQAIALINATNDVTNEQISAIKQKLKKGDIPASEATNALEDLYNKHLQLPPEPTNFCDDVTPQRLFQKLHAHGGAYGVFSSDARKIIKQILGKGAQGGVTSEDIFVAASWGDTIHRSRVMGKDPSGEDLFIRKPALTMSLLVHQDLFTELLLNKTMRESGLISRFCTISPLSMMGTRFESENDLPLDKSKIHSFTAALLKLRRWKVDKPYLLQMDHEAAAARRQFYNNIESELAPGGGLEDVKDIATRATSITARIAGLYAVLDSISLGDVPDLKSITIGQWLRAQQTEEYFLSQLIDRQRSEMKGGKLYLLQKAVRWLLKEILKHKDEAPRFILASELLSRVRGLNEGVIENYIIPELEKKGWIRKYDSVRTGASRYEVNSKIRRFNYGK